MVRMTGGVVLIWLVYLVGGGGDVNGRTGGEGAGDANMPEMRLFRSTQREAVDRRFLRGR